MAWFGWLSNSKRLWPREKLHHLKLWETASIGALFPGLIGVSPAAQKVGDMDAISSASRASNSRASGRSFRLGSIVLRVWPQGQESKLIFPHRSTRARFSAGRTCVRRGAAARRLACVTCVSRVYFSSPRSRVHVLFSAAIGRRRRRYHGLFRGGGWR